jgi:hypothetical protein
MLSMKKYIIKFWQTFIHPRVIVFILTGTAVIFLTFLTNNNALEIAISGIASVFIGIGVNNLSMLEAHLKDEQKSKSKTRHILKLVEITRSQVNRLYHEASHEKYSKITAELAELEQLINLSIQLIKEDSMSG